MSATIKVLEQSPSQLVISRVIHHGGFAEWFYVIFLLSIFLLCGYVFMRVPKVGWRLFAVGFGIAWLAIFFVAWSVRYGITTSIVFSRPDASVTSTTRWISKTLDVNHYALDKIAYADLETARYGTTRLVLITRDNNEITPLGDVYNDDQGYRAAQAAINQWLGTTAQGAHPNPGSEN